MTSFPAYAARFHLHPQSGPAFEHLSPLLTQLQRVDFSLRVDDPKVNQGQMASDFDHKLEDRLQTLGALPCHFALPPDVPQELDFAFEFGSRTVAVEIEKANREKILRDILKCHMYLHSGADFAVVALPRNYPHAHGVWNLIDFGIQRYNECEAYGFGTQEKLGRILLLGYEQYETTTGEALSVRTRMSMRNSAARGVSS